MSNTDVQDKTIAQLVKLLDDAIETTRSYGRKIEQRDQTIRGMQQTINTLRPVADESIRRGERAEELEEQLKSYQEQPAEAVLAEAQKEITRLLDLVELLQKAGSPRPAHPERLTTEDEYEAAPVGTLLAGSDEAHGAGWERREQGWGGRGAPGAIFTPLEMSDGIPGFTTGASRRVIRWGEDSGRVNHG